MPMFTYLILYRAQSKLLKQYTWIQFRAWYIGFKCLLYYDSNRYMQEHNPFLLIVNHSEHLGTHQLSMSVCACICLFNATLNCTISFIMLYIIWWIIEIFDRSIIWTFLEIGTVHSWFLKTVCIPDMNILCNRLCQKYVPGFCGWHFFESVLELGQCR